VRYQVPGTAGKALGRTCPVGVAIASYPAYLQGESLPDAGKLPGATGEADGEWQLYWTARGRPVPCRLMPVLSGWADLDQREDAADIGPGHPVLIDPEWRLDPVLARFLGRSRFAWLAGAASPAVCAQRP
jgi:hypothetical protein